MTFGIIALTNYPNDTRQNTYLNDTEQNITQN